MHTVLVLGALDGDAVTAARQTAGALAFASTDAEAWARLTAAEAPPVGALLVAAAAVDQLEALRARAAAASLPPVILIARDAAEAARAADHAPACVAGPWPECVGSAVRQALCAAAVDDSAGTAARHRAAFFEFSLDMLCVADFRGYFLQLNPAWSALGWTMDELKSKPFLEFVHPDDIAPTLDVMGRLTTSDYSTIAFENRYLCKDGSYRWLLWSSRTSYHAQRPEDRLYFAVARDITERKAAEEELRRQTERLARSNADLEQFAHVASHDLQEPLRMVSSYVKLLEKRYRGQLDEQADKYIHYAVDGASRMHALVNDLLAYARLNSQGLALAPTRIESVVEKVSTDLTVRLRELGGQLTWSALPVVLADPGLLRQALQNLVGNALKFHREGVPPQVRVDATECDGEVEVTVTDNGIGIAKEHHEQIFELFRRLHGRGEYEGTGLGLAIVKRIVERHGGRIWLDSLPGRTCFHFTLRAVPA